MQSSSNRFYEFGPFRVDTAKRMLLREGEPVSLSPKAFDTLLMLVQHAGEVLEKDRLMDLLWPDSAVEEANLPLNVSALRKALGETPNERRYITTIPGRGYRFGAAVQVLGGEEPDLILEHHQRATVVIREHDPSDNAQSHSSERLLAAPSAANRWKRTAVSIAALVLLGAVVAVVFIRRGVEEQRSTRLIKSLAVLPFKPLDEASGDELLGLGMADSLITRLSNLRQVVVLPTSSVSRRSFEGKECVDIGRELRVEAVLESSIRRADGKVRLTVRLVRVEDSSPLWGDHFDAKDADMLTLEDSLIERVAAALVTKLTGEESKVLTKRNTTNNAEAYEFYTKGRACWNKKHKYRIEKAIEFFEQAIDKDPNYAQPYAGLADCYRLQLDQPPKEVMRKAKDYAVRALQIDDSLAEAHVSLATIKFQYDVDLPGADREYRRAIELDPNYTYGHNIYAHYLSLCGRFDEAAAELKQAKELEPIEKMRYRVEGMLYYLEGHFDQAIEIFRSVLEMEPEFFQARVELGLAYEQKGMYEEALGELQLGLAQEGHFSKAMIQADIGHLYGVWGKRSQARKVLDKLLEQSKREYVPAYDIAVVYAGLGEKDQAMDWLDKAYDDRSFWLSRVKLDPRLEICRSDPRFTNLLRKVGLQ